MRCIYRDVVAQLARERAVEKMAERVTGKSASDPRLKDICQEVYASLFRLPAERLDGMTEDELGGYVRRTVEHACYGRGRAWNKWEARRTALRDGDGKETEE